MNSDANCRSASSVLGGSRKRTSKAFRTASLERRSSLGGTVPRLAGLPESWMPPPSAACAAKPARLVKLRLLPNSDVSRLEESAMSKCQTTDDPDLSLRGGKFASEDVTDLLFIGKTQCYTSTIKTQPSNANKKKSTNRKHNRPQSSWSGRSPLPPFPFYCCFHPYLLHPTKPFFLLVIAVPRRQ